MSAKTSAPKDTWTHISPSRGGSHLGMAEAWSHRELVRFFVERDLKIRFKQTVLGVAWALIQPLVSVVLFTVIFGNLAGIPSDGLPYPVFVLIGVAVWQYFSTSVTAGAGSLVSHAELVNKVYFPRVLAPISSVGAPGVDFLVALGLIGVALPIYGVAPGLQVVALPVLIVWAVAVAAAVSIWLSALNVAYRDVRYATPFMLQIWMYASPVVFSTSLVPSQWQYVFALNPMVGVIDGIRWAIADGPAPGAYILVSAATTIVLGLAGLAYFRRSERAFADLI